jgi:hypothetical protein
MLECHDHVSPGQNDPETGDDWFPVSWLCEGVGDQINSDKMDEPYFRSVRFEPGYWAQQAGNSPGRWCETSVVASKNITNITC